MSLSREVAEAYIQVHGDMAPFRHDLEKMAKNVREAAQANADEYSEAFGKRLGDKTRGQWSKIMDAAFYDSKVDWDRAIGAFDSKNLEDAQLKMHAFVEEMDRLGKLDGPDGKSLFGDLINSIDEAIIAREALDVAMDKDKKAREEEQQGIKDTTRYNRMWRDKFIADLQAAKIENDAWHARRRQTMGEAIADNDKFDRSFDGLSKRIKRANLGADFEKIAAAVNNADWGKMMKGFESFDAMRDRVAEVTAAMEEQGRVSRGNSFAISASVQDWIADQDDGTESVRRTTTEGNKLTKVWRVMAPLIQKNLDKLKGFAGLNVLGRLVRDGSEFFKTIDEQALKIGKMTLMFGSMAVAGISALGGISTVAADLTTTLGGLAVALPGFLVAGAIQVGVLVAAFKDMKTVLKDLAPMFKDLQNQISAKFWAQAAEPIRSMVKELMPTLKTQLSGTASSLGGLFGKLATAVKDIPVPYIEQMFGSMNKAIDIAGGAMGPLVQAFTTLGLAGSMYFERFSTWLVTLSTDFNNFITAAAEDGRLLGWIDAMIEGFKQVGTVIASAWGIMSALNDAAVAAGGQGLAGLAQNIAAVSIAELRHGPAGALQPVLRGGSRRGQGQGCHYRNRSAPADRRTHHRAHPLDHRFDHGDRHRLHRSGHG